MITLSDSVGAERRYAHALQCMMARQQLESHESEYSDFEVNRADHALKPV